MSLKPNYWITFKNELGCVLLWYLDHRIRANCLLRSRPCRLWCTLRRERSKKAESIESNILNAPGLNHTWENSIHVHTECRLKALVFPETLIIKPGVPSVHFKWLSITWKFNFLLQIIYFCMSTLKIYTYTYTLKHTFSCCDTHVEPHGRCRRRRYRWWVETARV